ncbi:MAG TPA: hypothetical protein VJ725_01285 [Thermoanaerobaculia bacterium]|nr:hypothetical protein [Thermoanaerobaculia bacterium]
MSDENLKILLSYLRASSQHSLEELRRQLLAAGHPPEAVNQAIAEFQAQERPIWGLALLVTAVDLALLGMAAAIFFLAMEGRLEKDLGKNILLGLPGLYLAQIVIGAILFAFPGMRRLGRGLLFGGVLTGVVTFLAIGGLCVGIF